MGRRLSAPGRQQASGPPAAGVLPPTLFHAFRPLRPGAGQVFESSRRLPFFATGLIAAKPEKPCDGGVFGVFYLLLKKERNEAGRAADGIFCTQTGRIAWRPISPACRNQGPAQSPAMPRLLLLPASDSLRWFRYGFDSRQAPKTVRWGRFRGLLFAPEKRAKRDWPGCGWASCDQTGRIAWRPICPPRKARPCPGFCCCPHPAVCAGFATGLIAAKPVKPCDGGVFGAFYLLLKKERLVTGAAGAAAKSFLQAARWRPCETAGQRAAFCHERRLP